MNLTDDEKRQLAGAIWQRKHILTSDLEWVEDDDIRVSLNALLSLEGKLIEAGFMPLMQGESGV